MSYSPAPLTDRRSLVIDASLAVRVILPIFEQDLDILNQLVEWRQDRVQLFAPEIWLPEVVSVVRQAIYAHILSEEEGRVAVEDAFRLDVEVLHSDEALCKRALAWAERLAQSKAYDSFYLALAERMGGDLWTGDRRLFNRAQQLGIGWVKLMSGLEHSGRQA
jgi:predicted nucleic acid-binding protein